MQNDGLKQTEQALMPMLSISWLTQATLECVTSIKYAFYLAAAKSRAVVRNFSGMLHSSGAASTESCHAFPLPSQPCQPAYPEGGLAHWETGSCQTYLLKREGVTCGVAKTKKSSRWSSCSMIPLPPGAPTEKSRIFHCIHHPIIGKETPVFPELQNELEIAHCGCTVSLLWAKGDVKN